MAFLQEPRRPHEPVLRAPSVVIGLIGAIVAAHIARIFGPSTLSTWMLVHLALVPAVYSPAWLAAHPGFDMSWIGDAIPFVGYIFLHANATHLIINCLWLLAFGPPVARRLGTVRFLL